MTKLNQRVGTTALLASALCLSVLSGTAQAQLPLEGQVGIRDIALVPQQPPAPTPAPAPGGQPPAGQRPPGGAPGAPQAPSNKPKPYGDVITKEAKTDDGLIKTHEIGEKYYFEIPKSALDKPMLWVTTFSRIQAGYLPFGLEVQDRVVQWEKRGDKILLRSPDYQTRSAVEGASQKSVDLLNVAPILMTFNIAAYGPDDSCVIEATPILMADPAEFSAKRALGASRMDPSRSFVDSVKSFPQNVEMKILATYVALPSQGFGGGGGVSRDTGTDAVTIELHHSLVLLPEKPMRPRLYDSRVGWFATGYYEFGGENRAKEVVYINRWRLEKKDPTAALSEPVKPITYYLAPEVPEKWRPYLKKGIEEWNAAFEKAGFKNAVVCRDAPTKEEDPEFDADDVRYTVLRWLPTTIENAYGPSVVDPRSGEILNGGPKFFHDILKLVENWYFVQASPNDPTAQKLPLSDAQIGPLIAYVATHEVGHTLGFPHNMKASSSFSIKQLRDPAFTAQWGTEASIMDYGRNNYVAQPSDGVKQLTPKLGPYDYFATEWGYKPIDVPTPQLEKPELDKLASAQITNPMLRFGNANPLEDPHRQTEDLGDDPVAATDLGLKNLDRVLGYIVPATSKPGEDYQRLQEVYDTVLNQRLTELIHVTAVVGGMVETEYHYERGGAANYTPVPAAQQKRAVQFLIKSTFQTPQSLIRPDIVNRLGATGIADEILAEQNFVLGRLLYEGRARRMVEIEAQAKPGEAVYTLAELVEDTRKGVWSELTAPTVKIDSYRRNFQRLYIQGLSARLNTSTSELRPLLRMALTDTKAEIKTALAHTTDRTTKAHLMDCNQLLQQALFPK